MNHDIQFKVVAVIVTYNRLELLRTCLDAVEVQTVVPDMVVIIDNHSTDGTKEFCEHVDSDVLRVLYKRLPYNGGGSLGFHEGVKQAMAYEADWIWLMDDDTIPSPQALEQLLDSPQINDPRTGYICSRVNNPEGLFCGMNIAPLLWEWPYLYTPHSDIFLVQNCSFVSVLVSRSAVSVVGLPVKEFFIWWDDVEYTLRISNLYNGYLNLNSIVTHMTTESGTGSDYREIDNDNLWKYHFGLRNQLALQMRYSGIRGLIKGLHMILTTVKVMVTHHKSLSIILNIVAAGFTGLFFFPYKKYITYYDPGLSIGNEI